MKNQKKIGNKYEKELCNLLQANGYWCHLFEYNSNGQPCDVVALKEDKSFLIDVKHCEGDIFYFSRIEPNQKTCFEYASKICKIKNVGFAIYFDNKEKFYWLPYHLTKNSKINSVVSAGLKLIEVKINED